MNPDLGQAAIRAVGAAVLGAGIWIGLAGPFQLTWGLLAVAVFVGWLIGSAARSRARGSDPRVRVVAAGAALGTWLLALVGVYVYLAALPSAPAPSGGFVGSIPIVDYYAQSLGVLDLLEAALLVATAWWFAR